MTYRVIVGKEWRCNTAEDWLRNVQDNNSYCGLTDRQTKQMQLVGIVGLAAAILTIHGNRDDLSGNHDLNQRGLCIVRPHSLIMSYKLPIKSLHKVST
jgi:hypothetical protein